MKPEHKKYLDKLRQSGATNMFGAAAYLMREFSLDRQEAQAILSEWMKTFKTDD